MSAIRSRRRRTALLTAAVLLTALLAATPWTLRSLLWRWESNPVLRGRLLAAELGCASCHTPYAAVEIPNPGSRWGTVPRFGAGNAFMYATDRATLAEFIRDGAPSGWRDDPEVRARLAAQRLRMPAFGDRLDGGELDDLVAYVAAVEGVERAGGEAASAGREVARRHGCLSCHGVEGAGGHPNPGSLGGFIPGFLGRNFTDLVQSEEEFREWVRTGTSRRLAANPLIRYFWRRQEVAMPAYGDDLTDEDLTHLWQWIQSVRIQSVRIQSVRIQAVR